MLRCVIGVGEADLLLAAELDTSQLEAGPSHGDVSVFDNGGDGGFTTVLETGEDGDEDEDDEGGIYKTGLIPADSVHQMHLRRNALALSIPMASLVALRLRTKMETRVGARSGLNTSVTSRDGTLRSASARPVS